MVKRATKIQRRNLAPVPDRRDDLSSLTIGTIMRLTLAKLRDELRKRLVVEGIPWSVWYFLRALWDDDELTQRELTARVGMRQPTTVSALQTMEHLGLVTLRRDAEDRRKLRICLTDKGRRLKEKLLPDVIALNDDVALKDFSDKETAEFRRLLLKMSRNLAEFSRGRHQKPSNRSTS
jgi:DNA-binding MarR family transcriptional regulator